MAIESAFVLSRSLKEQADYKSALKRYESERHERTTWITNTSWTIGKGAQVGNSILCVVRNFLVRITPAGVMQKNIHRAAGDSLVCLFSDFQSVADICHRAREAGYEIGQSFDLGMTDS